ncbi:MAG: glycosyltransferase family 4 protein [Lewinella sp.]|nr:glycosyltransferase family 4 protein [Lewinella sp.]
MPLGIDRTGIPSVVTIHDLIFYHYPAQYRALDRRVYAAKFAYACRHADAVVAISEATKQDIQHFYGTPSEKIHVVYQPSDERFLRQHSPGHRAEVARRYGLPAGFSLFVGSLIERKNLLGVVEALALLPPSLRHPLVVVGRGPEAYRRRVVARAQLLGIADLLYFVQVSYGDLPTVYQLAAAFLYLLYYEGFGIPVVEALNSGVPVLTSNRSALPEAAGPHSLLSDPTDAADLALNWQRVLEDTALVATMRREGMAHAERFSPARVLPPLTALYARLAR